MNERIEINKSKQKVIGNEESGIFLLISPQYGESALVVKEEGKTTYVVTSFGVGLSEIKRVKQYGDAKVYRLDGLIDLNYINFDILDELRKQAKSSIPIQLVASNRVFTFEILLKDGKILDITAYFEKPDSSGRGIAHLITGFTALRLLISSKLDYVDKYESMIPDVVKLDVPVDEILYILRVFPHEAHGEVSEARRKEETKVKSKVRSFTRIINGLSIKRGMWSRYLEYLSRKGFSGAASSSEGHLVIFRNGRMVEERDVSVDYECDHFRVWAIEFDSEYQILNSTIQIGFVELYLPHFLSRMEIEAKEVEFFLFAGFEYELSLTSEILARWNRAFVSFFDDMDLVDISGMDWVIVDVDRVRLKPEEIMPFLDRIIFVGDPAIPGVSWKVDKPFNRESLSRILEEISRRDEKRTTMLICSEVKTLIERLKRHIITWPMELSKIKVITGIDPENLEKCTPDELEKLKEFLRKHYGI